ncbi:MAG: aspartate kinase [Candidatus Paceibacterota bacterium]
MNRKIIVNKFGGGILKNDLFPIISKRIKEQLATGGLPVVVVSAMPGITDKLLSGGPNYIRELRDTHYEIISSMGFKKEELIKLKEEIEKLFDELARRVLKKTSQRTVLANEEDRVVSYGEKLSATIIAAYFNSIGIKSKRFLAEEIPIMTDDHFKNANIDYKISEKNIKSKLSGLNVVPVIAGFTGITKKGETTTLGRGGTDTTACFVGAALQADKIILWKDVGGVLSADPKVVKTAKTIPFISYLEAEEAGKIIHDKAIQYVKMYKTEIEIASITNPKFSTKIGEIKKQGKGAKIVSYKKDLNLLLITDEVMKVNDLMLLVCETFKKYKVEMVLISNTRYSLQIVADKSDEIEMVYNEIKSKVEEIELIKASMVFLVGNFEAKDVSNFNDLLVKLGTDLQISAFYFDNCKRIEAVIRTENIEKVVNSLYKKFIK